MSKYTGFTHAFSSGAEKFLDATDVDRDVTLKVTGSGRIGYTSAQVATTSDGFPVVDGQLLGFRLEGGEELWGIRTGTMSIDVLTTMVK